MFFNDDILYRSGPLAIVWMAGNDAFKTKKGRNRKSFVRCIKADIPTICQTLESLLPQMGSAHGIPLKKMGFLAKGMGFIYYLKIEDFAREVTQAALALKKPVHLPLDVAPSKTGKAKIRALDLPEENMVGDFYVAEEDQMDLYGFGNFCDSLRDFAFPSPRRGQYEHASLTPRRSDDPFGRATPPRGGDVDRGQRSARKRKRDDGNVEGDILQRLQERAAQLDERSHLLLEEEPGVLRGEAQVEGIDLDFGDGLALMAGVGDPIPPAFQDEMQPAPGQPDDYFLAPPPSTIVDDDRMGPPTHIEDDSGSKVQETPAGQGTRPENGRKRRNEGREVLDVTVMELPDLENGDRTRRVKRGRRRLVRLQVDVDPTITLPQLLHAIEDCKATDNLAALEARLEEGRAAGKSEWKFIKRAALGLITSQGRPGGLQISEMVEDIMRKQKMLPKRTVEVQRSGEDTNTIAGAGVSVVAGAAVRSVQDPGDWGGLGEENVVGNNTTTAVPGISTVAEGEAIVDRNDQPSPPIIEAAPQDYPAFDEAMGGVGEMAPVEEAFPAPEARPKRKSKIDDQSALAKRLVGGSTFEQLFPPNKAGKAHVARAFLQILKMQAKKQVYLTQDECFGDINIEKLH